jgi:uncharacterized peroxidase-related enzyme
MPRIQPVTDQTAPATAKPLLAAVKQQLGMVPNLFATIAQSPESLASLLTAMDALGKGAMSAREIELVNLYTSELNGCGYCISAHTALGKRAGLSADEIDRARTGDAPSPRERALLALVRRVVRTGGAAAGTELAQAREAGIADRDVIELLAHVALKTFTNAVALVAQTDIDFPKAPRLPTP